MTKPPGAPAHSTKQPPLKGGSKRTTWIPKAARRAGRRLRAWTGSFKLEPLANVTLRGPGHFHAENGDPQLTIVPPFAMPVGWVRLELTVASKPAYPFSPQLFFDLGKGWSGADSVRLPAPGAGRLIAFLRFPAGIRRLRLDVGDTRGEFRIIALGLKEISAPEAWLGHLGRAGLGRVSWHPSHPWERRRQLLPAVTRRLLSSNASEVALPDAVHGPEQALAARTPQLALYATEDNETRAPAVQRGHSTMDRRRVVMDRGVSVLILNLNKPELIVPLLDRLEVEQRAFAERGLRLQVIVGDTGSTDADVLKRYESLAPDMLVQRNLKYHFSRCNNTIAQLAECDTLLFLNNDVIFPEDRPAILEMHDLLHVHRSRGVVGCCLFYADGRVQHLGVDFLRDAHVRGLCFHPRVRAQIDGASLKSSWRVPAVTGACLMIRHTLYAEVGGMDEGYAAECQDIALCLSVDRLGYESHIAYAGPVLHLENATRPKGEENWPDRQRFLRRWGSYIEATYL
jgi:GT2 family glycosyltransferase